VAADHVSGPPSRLRDMSRRLVLDEVARSQPISQAEIVRRTGLSRTTVASVVTEFADLGRIAVRTAGEPGGRGRPPRLLRLTHGDQVVAGIDFDHAQMDVALADLGGTILMERNVPMDVDRSAADCLDAAATTLREMIALAGASPLAVTMGVPGPVDRSSGEMRSGTILPGWVGSRPAVDLGERIGQPVVVENDANLGAIGEHAYGVAREVDDLIYIKVSSGIGAGVILDGRLHRGARGTAGEIGHVQVSEDGALCRCGSRGCLETLSSTHAALDLLSASRGRRLTLTEMISMVRAGDPGAVRLFTDMGTAIGRVVAAVSANLDPAMIVVGGQVVDDPGPLINGISAAVRRYTQPYLAANLMVVGGTLGARSGLFGALALSAQRAAIAGQTP